MRVQELIADAARAFERRDLQAAERACRAILAADPGQAEALHLLGLVRRQTGDAAEADRLLRASIALAPQRAEFRVNLSSLLRSLGRLRDAEGELRAALGIEPASRAARLALARLLNEGGAPAQAESEARSLVARDPDDAEAWIAIAVAQRALGRLAEAEASYRRGLLLRPDYPVARHNLGALLCQLGRAEEALQQLDRAGELGASGPELHYNRASALLALARFDDAEAALSLSIRIAPHYLESYVLLAKLRHMQGEADYTRELAATAAGSDDPRLKLALGDLLRQGGRLAEAADVLRSVASGEQTAPEVASSLAVVLQEQGDLDGALRYARAALAGRPADPSIAENLIAIELQLGDVDRSMPLILQQRQRQPLDQRWLAYEATAARLAGSGRYQELYDYQRFVQVFDLEPPPGYGTIEQFNAELARHLVAQHRLKAHPLDQSLRHGTQTSRSLLVDPDPLVRSFLDALVAPIAAYRSRIGSDPRHPHLARNSGPGAFAGCWSVRLGRGGFHVNHLHPQGWISSAYYVELPPETEDRQLRSGWIKFGEPRMRTPGAEAELFVQPRIGRLVLFPSYMWHGTTPILGEHPRMSIAFDVVTKQSS